MTKPQKKRKKKRRRIEKVKGMLREIVCDLYRFNIISNVNATQYMDRIEKI